MSNDNMNMPWNPEWDFLDADEIEKRLSEQRQDDQAAAAFAKAIDDLFDQDEPPDSPMPEGARNLLAPLFGAFMDSLDREDRAFSSGNIILNFRQYKRMYMAWDLAKNMKSRGTADKIRVDFKKGKRPSEISFETKRLDVSDAEKETLADIVSGAGVVDAACTLDGKVRITFTFPDMWLSIHDAAVRFEPPNTL